MRVCCCLNKCIVWLVGWLVGWRSREQLSMSALPCRVKTFLDTLLWDRELHPEDIYRIKGALHIAGNSKKHIVQVRTR